MQLLEGRAALVTGGSRGIGRAIVLDLATHGADVAFTYRKQADRAQEAVDQIKCLGRHGLAYEADVRDLAMAHRVVEQVISTWGRLDILVNNASIQQNEVIWAMDEAQWDEVLAVNLKGTFNYIHAAASHFRSQKSGKIVNVASLQGLRGRQAGSNYAASKAGVIGLSKSVARDLAPYGINVNVVAPGTTETDMVRALPQEVRAGYVAEILLGRIGQPEDIAHLVTFLSSDWARHITGEVIKVDGGQYI